MVVLICREKQGRIFDISSPLLPLFSWLNLIYLLIEHIRKDIRDRVRKAFRKMRFKVKNCVLDHVNDEKSDESLRLELQV